MPSMKLTPSMGILTTKHENLQPNRHQKDIVRGRKKRFFSDISKENNQSSGSQSYTYQVL